MPRKAHVIVIDETTYQDGSGWNALVEVEGIRFFCSFSYRLMTGVPGSRHSHAAPPKWIGTLVSKWARKKVCALPGEWHVKNAAMYAEELAAAAAARSVPLQNVG